MRRQIRWLALSDVTRQKILKNKIIIAPRATITRAFIPEIQLDYGGPRRRRKSVKSQSVIVVLVGRKSKKQHSALHG